MAKSAHFSVGSSGSGKHTETTGDGSQLGGRAPAERGPSIGPGVMGRRMKADYDKSGGSGAPEVKGMKTYSKGDAST